jgi:predicted dehydrogenase
VRTPVTVAVVCGANGLGDALARGFDRLPQASLRWICDDVKRSASIGYGPETAWTMDFDELLQDEDLDAIAFASPGQAEPWRALAALEAEKHVFVDGPLRCSSSDAERLVAAATQGNRTLLAQTPALLRPEVLRLHRLIGRGALGEIYYLHARRFALRPDGEFDLLRDLGLDLVALALDLIGDEPVETSATGESYVGNERPDVVFATLRFATGINAHVHLSCLEGESAERISVVGSKAAAVLDVSDPSRALSVYANGAAPSVFEELPIEPGDRIAYRPAPDDSLRLACSRFVSAVRSHGDVSVGREAAAALAVVEALEQSCRHRGAAESVASRSAQEGKVVAFRAGGVTSVTRQLS